MSIASILTGAGVIIVSSLSQMSGIVDSTANGKPAIVNIYSEFCGYSQQMANVYASYVPLTAHNNVSFYGADANEVSGIGSKYGIQGVPTFIGFACGKELNRVTGADPNGLSELLTQLGNAQC